MVREWEQRRTWCSLGVRHLRLPEVKSGTRDPRNLSHGRTEIETVRSLQETHPDVSFPASIFNPDNEIAGRI